jgi:hypothetical protein
MTYWALSKRGYPMLRALATGGRMTIEEAQHYDQRPFRSMLVRKWAVYTGNGFRITPEGKQAWFEFENTSIERKDPTKPLTAYFDPDAYGLKRPSKVRVMAKRHVA